MTGAASALDLDAYLRRIEYAGERAATRATLDALHLAHATHIPFENLDVLLGRPIRLDLPALQAKLVAARRGGYCFEQNTLFAAALEALGFRVTRLAARVRLGATSMRPRTHMALAVEIDGASLLADVGFGNAGLVLPLPFADGEVVRQYAWAYRLRAEGGTWVLQAERDGDFADLYAFTLEPQHAVDYEMANWFTSTSPSSSFTQVLTAQRAAPDVRRMLRDRVYTEDRGAVVEQRTLADDDEVLRVLAADFGLEFPPGTRFRRQ
jgi:N-hydroxyarylamine O-acetyltransferase